MLAMLFIVIVSYLPKLAHLEISIKFLPAIMMIGILSVLLLIVSCITHKSLITSKEENGEYLCALEEPGVIVFGVIYSCIATALMCIMLAFMNSEISMIIPITISMIIMAIMDIIGIAVFFHSYTYDLKESIKDSLVHQMELVQYALLLMIAVAFAVRFTLLGGLILMYVIIRIAILFRR